MRSRPDLTVYLIPSTPSPGERLRVRVHLQSRSTTPYDAIDVTLVGRESRYRRTTRVGNAPVRHFHRRDVLRLGYGFPAGVLEPGAWERDVTFDLPADIPPSYQSALAAIEYELSVRVNIPWWPDRHETYAVQVIPAAAEIGPPRPRSFTSQVGESRGDGPVLELSLESDRLPLGGTLSGAAAVLGLGDKRLRRVELSLCAQESARVQSSAGPTVVEHRTWILHEGTPDEGAAIPFRLAIPGDIAAAFASPFIAVDHFLEANAIVAFGRDFGIRVPVAVLRPATPRPRAESELPLVGRERHVAVWREAVSKVRLPGAETLRVEPERAMAAFAVRGIEVTVTEEHREGLGPCLVADMDYAALGLGVRVAERRWTELGGRIEAVDRAFQKRFTVRAREAAQVARLLDAEVCAAFAVFDEVGLDDDGCTALRKGGVHQVAGLSRFLSLAHMLASQLARTIEALPPPAALASALPGYQRFAAALGARLRIGDLSLHDLAIRGIPLSLEHVFQEERPVESRLWTPLDEGMEPQGWIEAIARATGKPALLEAGRVGVKLATVTDPEAALPVAEALAGGVARLRGGGGAGPYR